LKLAEKSYPELSRLGFEGVWIVDAMPVGLFNCFDPSHKHPPTRRSVAEGYRAIAALTKETFGGCHAENAQDFMAGAIDAISSVTIAAEPWGDERQRAICECFISEFVPFYQIAYHGLIVYHFRPASEEGLLREIELGAMPRIEMGPEAKGDHAAWLEENLPLVKKQYDVLCDALGDLQLAHIDDHKYLAEGVSETTYSNGAKIVVNHTMHDFKAGDIVVKAKWYARLAS